MGQEWPHGDGDCPPQRHHMVCPSAHGGPQEPARPPPPPQAQAWPKTLQKVGKLEKHHKSWKFLEILGNSWKIEGFPTFFVKKVGKPVVF